MFRIKHCREIVLKILYQADVLNVDASLRGQLIEEYFQTFRRLSEEEEAYVTRMIDHVFENRKPFDRVIQKHLVGWKIGRISPIDRVLLRMGMAEAALAGHKAIIIDDIIRIAKKYGEQESYKFINAILDKVIA